MIMLKSIINFIVFIFQQQKDPRIFGWNIFVQKLKLPDIDTELILS